MAKRRMKVKKSNVKFGKTRRSKSGKIGGKIRSGLGAIIDDVPVLGTAKRTIQAVRTPSGQVVMRRSKRMNVLNVRALSKATRRLSGFTKKARTVEKQLARIVPRKVKTVIKSKR